MKANPAPPAEGAAIANMELSAETIERFAAMVGGAICLHFGLIYWIHGNVHLYHEVVAMDFAVYALAFGLFWLALIRAPNWTHWTGALVLTAVAVTTFTGTYVWTHNVRQIYGTDVMAFEHYAAKLVLQGIDPYTVSMRPALQQFHVPLLTQTLTWDGRTVDRLSWPAGSFLLFVPFVACGVSDLRWIVLLFELAVIGVLYGAAPRHLRPLVLLPMFASLDLADLSNGGTIDFPWVLPLLLLIVWQRRPILAGLCYGAACAVKQEPWILAPFLVVYFLRDGDRELTTRRRLANFISFALPATALFIILNGPFIVHDPRNWALGTLEPAIGNLIPIGGGPSILTQLGFPLPADVYTLGAAGIAALLIFYYALYFDRLRDVLWLCPMIITWFMPRSLHNYFVFWIPVVTLVLVLRARAA